MVEIHSRLKPHLIPSFQLDSLLIMFIERPFVNLQISLTEIWIFLRWIENVLLLSNSSSNVEL